MAGEWWPRDRLCMSKSLLFITTPERRSSAPGGGEMPRATGFSVGTGRGVSLVGGCWGTSNYSQYIFFSFVFFLLFLCTTLQLYSCTHTGS